MRFSSGPFRTSIFLQCLVLPSRLQRTQPREVTVRGQTRSLCQRARGLVGQSARLRADRGHGRSFSSYCPSTLGLARKAPA